MRELVSRVRLKDCVKQTFRAGGKGGQHQNVTDSGVRIIHPPSGARGECREERSQLQNKKVAFRRMAESPLFQAWAQAQVGNLDIPPSRSTERVRSYNFIDRRVTDHRTKHQSSNIDAIIDGDIDSLYKEK